MCQNNNTERYKEIRPQCSKNHNKIGFSMIML